ncbi:UNVERIFIED_CONTAM: hypothetical protein K2H54_003456 [Gekko kuhli]
MEQFGPTCWSSSPVSCFFSRWSWATVGPLASKRLVFGASSAQLTGPENGAGREKMVADLSESAGVRSDCENPVGKNLANGHIVDASEQEMSFLKGPLGTGGICANDNKWKCSTIGLSVLLAISVTMNICLLAKLRQVPAAPHPLDTMSPSLDASPCPQRWVRNEGRCYFFSDTEATWNTSRIECSSQGGSLLAMDTPQEWVRETFMLQVAMRPVCSCQ